jgi:hypothetical protein
MPRGRQEELRVWLPPELYNRVLRESAVRGVSLSRCVRDRLEAHFGLEEELLDIIERKDVPSADQATGTALRLRLLDELEERLGATLGRQAESLEQIASDVRLVACLVDRAYVGLLATLAFQDLGDVDARTAQVGKYHATWRRAAGRLWRDGGLAFHLTAGEQSPEGDEK